MGKLNAAKLRTLTKPGTFGDGDGLYLQVRGPEQRSWLYRFKLHLKPHLMGLGPFPDVGLADARDAATAARQLVRLGINPIEARRVAKTEASAPHPATRTFESVALAYIAKSEVDWKNAKHREQWRNTLTSYVYPIIGSMDVADVDIAAVRLVLDPIWREKPETAIRVRGRIETVLDYAEAETWRAGDNPARFTKRLSMLLGERGPKAKVKHHAALPWKEIGGCMAKLAGQGGVAAMALQFVILTATRTNEALGATWGEISLDSPDSPIWTIPADRMKASREHRVPLSGGAVAILREAAKLRAQKDDGNAPLFPGQRIDKTLSNMALLMLLRRMERKDLTTHGFRSTFRDWCAEGTNYPREIAEAALAHAPKDKTAAAYQRGDLLTKRRKLMEDWSEFCIPCASIAGDVRSAGA